MSINTTVYFKMKFSDLIVHQLQLVKISFGRDLNAKEKVLGKRKKK